MNSKSSIIGIDFGTTKSVVSLWDDHKAKILKDEQGRKTVPSYVLITPGDLKFAGWEAKNYRLGSKEEEYVKISSVKRRIGQTETITFQHWQGYPQEISAYVFYEIKQLAQKKIGGEVSKAIIGMPSHFDANQRQATKEAAQIVGLDPLRLLNEATAVALAQSSDSGEENFLVFDFGGGTLDISILKIGEGVYEVVNSAGYSDLGGDDFDKIIAEDIRRTYRRRYSTRNIVFGSGSNIELREIAENLKKSLSSTSKAEITRKGFVQVEKSYKKLEYCLYRDEFEEMIAPLLKRTKKLLNNVIVNSPVDKQDIDVAVLTGGSSRIPAVQEICKKKTNSRVVTTDPYAVARGAAKQAAIIDGEIGKNVLIDVAPSSLSVTTTEGESKTLIEKNTKLPTEKTKTFACEGGKYSIPVLEIREGEQKKAKENLKLGQIKLHSEPNHQASFGHEIDVTLQMDTNGLLHVSVTDNRSLKEEATIHAPCRLSQIQMENLKETVRSNVSKTRKREYVHEIIDILDREEPLYKGHREKLKKILKRLQANLKEDNISVSLIREAKTEVNKAEDVPKKVHDLVNEISLYVSEKENKWGAYLIKMEEKPELIRHKLEEGELTEDLVKRTRKDFKQKRKKISKAEQTLEKANVLLSLELSDQQFKEDAKRLEKDKRHLLRGERSLNIALEKINESIEDFTKKLYLEGNEKIRKTITNSLLKEEIEENSSFLKRQLLKKLDSVEKEELPNLSERLVTLVEVSNEPISNSEWQRIINVVRDAGYWDLDDLFSLAFNSLPTGTITDFFIYGPKIREKIKREDNGSVLERVKLELQRRVSLKPSKKELKAAIELCPDLIDEQLLSLLSKEVTKNVKKIVLNHFIQKPSSEISKPLLRKVPKLKEDVNNKLIIKILSKHEKFLNADENVDAKKMLRLTKKRLNNESMSTFDKLYLFKVKWFGSSHYDELLDFLKEGKS